MMLVLGLAVAVPATLIAQEPSVPGHMRGDMMHHCQMMMGMPAMALMYDDELELSPQQIEQLEDLHAEAQRTHVQALERMQALHERMVAASDPGGFDEQAVRALAGEAGEMHADRMVALLRSRHEAMQVLAPGQRQQLQALHEQHPGAAHRQHPMGMMMQCPMMMPMMPGMPGMPGMPHDRDSEHQHR